MNSNHLTETERAIVTRTRVDRDQADVERAKERATLAALDYIYGPAMRELRAHQLEIACDDGRY